MTDKERIESLTVTFSPSNYHWEFRANLNDGTASHCNLFNFTSTKALTKDELMQGIEGLSLDAPEPHKVDKDE